MELVSTSLTSSVVVDHNLHSIFPYVADREYLYPFFSWGLHEFTKVACSIDEMIGINKCMSKDAYIKYNEILVKEIMIHNNIPNNWLRQILSGL